jgi:hypothetical protein
VSSPSFAVPDTLWHYTCSDHGGALIGTEGTLRPGHDGVVWLTDLDEPHISALGMLPVMAKCNRAELRYRVTDVTDVVPWMEFRREIDGYVRYLLERDPAVMPRHWFVALRPVAATLDPMGRPR